MVKYAIRIMIRKGDRMKERFTRFMIGRNGNDQLNLFLLIVSVVLLVLGTFFGGVIRSIFRIAAFALLIYVYFRMLSKDVYQRREENGKYLQIRYRVFAKLKALKERWVQRKDFKFFQCPSCHAVLRVPRGRGKIKIVCRKCGNTFIGKS